MRRSLIKRIREKRGSENYFWKGLILAIDFIVRIAEWRRESLPLVRKVKAAKRARTEMGVAYKDHPRLSLVILSFNHRKNARAIIARLRKTQADEIIVCEDGSVDGSAEEWMKYLVLPNDFLVYSNDIHEIRAYDRAVRLARGRIICMLQDDDIPPESGEWVGQALRLFERYPKLAVLGGYRGRKFGSDVAEREPKYGYQTLWEKVKKIPFSEPDLRIPFMFIPAVSTAPLFCRRDAWIQLGGFDLNYSKAGEPGIGFDYEICFRAWLKGWQVGLYDPGSFKRCVGGSGTSIYCRSLRDKNHQRNQELIRKTQGR